jgi:ribonuclease BN (tRNA processing enzyme)
VSDGAAVATAEFEVSVLGSSSSIPRPGRACSAYLVRSTGRAVLFDLGSGAFANLRRYIAPEDVDAIVISHMHPDHFLDLVPMRYALRYGARTSDRRPVLYLPPGGEGLLRRMVDAFESEPRSDFLAVYDVRTYDPDGALRVGDLRLAFARTTHYIPAYAVRCEAAGRSVTYSADTAPDAGVAALARGTDIFLCEATLGPNGAEPAARGHVSAREAGAMAAQARARRLVLTHYGAEAVIAELEHEARAAYDGPVCVADDNERLRID